MVGGGGNPASLKLHYVAAGNKLYGIPNLGNNIICVDTVSKTQQYIGDFSDYYTYGNFKWSRGILTPNGKIYAAPYEANSILRIDTSDDSYSFIGDFSEANYDEKCFLDGFLAPNGKIYFMGENRCLCFDPSTETYTIYYDNTNSGGYHYYTLGPNNKIYGTSTGASSILRMDTNTDTLDFIDLPISDELGPIHNVILSGNMLYMCKRDVVLHFNTTTDTFDHIQYLFKNLYVEEFFLTFINNKIYGIPITQYGGRSILCIDVINRTYKILGDIQPDKNYTENEWSHIVVGADNRIYGIPEDATKSLLCFDPSTETINIYTDNVYGGLISVLADNNDIYILPYDTTETPNIIKLSQSIYTNEPELLNAFIKVDGSYKRINTIYVKTDGIYKKVNSMFIKVDNSWISV